jgi:hypothetical protein
MSRRSQFWVARSHLAVTLMVVAVLVGCVSGRGIQQFSLYRTAFDKANVTANAILDQLALRERQLFLSRHPANVSVTFNPNDASYYVDSVDPPGTGAFRRSLVTVKTYNDLLYGLASGQTAEALTAQLGELQVNVGKAITEIGGTAGAAGQAAVVNAALSSAFSALQPIIQRGLAYRSRAAMRVYLLESYEPIRNILLEIRLGTQDIFPLLADPVLKRSFVTGSPLTAEEAAKIDIYRKLLADWVILIDGTITALDQVHVAMSASRTVASTIAGLNTISLDLAATAEESRKHLAELAAL